MIRDAVDTEHVALLLREGNEYVQKYPPQPGRYPVVTLRDDDPLVLALRRSSDPVVTDVLIRKRPTPGRLALVEKMMSLKVSIAIGIPTHEPMDGIMLLGPRLSGRMFTNVEQDALQILCDQLAVALENARLYTQAQNSKRYNEILLDSLVSGVIAADAEGRVTVFNREACRLTGLNSDDVLQQPTGRLPLPLATVLNDTIENGQELRDLELVLEVDGENIPVRVGSSIFRGTSGNVIGALLVLSDQTQVRKLQAQVRRTDRLASVGTLSAGMAHEIKNPLVSLKTFTQLLPERYDDADFRDTFSSLLSHEVARIDSIVNQLLRFARPTKPELTPANLHEILDKALRLVEQPMQQKGITLDRQLSASTDRIRGDAGLLDQAFLNFFLNAIDAMEGSGQLGVTTEVIDNPWNAGIPDQTRDGPHIVVRISDTGKGIPEQDIPSIFDPFFTTKSEGTGLGLSVTHGIITEHEGTVEVETEPGHGTTFVVSFPLVRDKEPVA
jgi:PAS domain S-box-containing protein